MIKGYIFCLKSIFLYTVFLVGTFAQAQENIPIGTWRTHLSYQQAQKVAVAGSRIYCAAAFGIFYFDKEDNAVHKLGKMDGLSEVGVSAMNFDPRTQILVIAYSNGNIDLLKENTIVNLDDIKNIPLQGSKEIFDISFHENSAYLSTEFGVVVLDMERLEFKETYANIGVGGSSLRIYGSTIAKGSLFLATEAGVMAGPLTNNVNLLDFANWKRFSGEEGIPQVTIKNIASIEDNIFVGIDGDGLYQYQGNGWVKTSFEVPGSFNDLSATNGNLLICYESQLFSFALDNTFFSINSSAITSPQMAAVDQENIIWIADQEHGLLSNASGEFISYLPNGPGSNQIFKLYNFAGKTIALPGTKEFYYTPQEGRFSIFDDGFWKNFSSTSTIPMPEVNNLVDVAYHPASQKVYFASFDAGIMIWDQEQSFSIIDANTEGSPLASLGLDERTRITGLAVAPEGSLWVLNPANLSYLHEKLPDNGWNTYTLEIPHLPLNLLIADNGDKWIRLSPESGGGILVFNESGMQRQLTTQPGQGGLPAPGVNAMVKDENGQIWVGTDQGLAFFPDPATALAGAALDAVFPVYEGRALLRDENISALAIDGGNRIWIGTKNSLWLFDEGGDVLVSQFRKDNSPLLSDNILDIAIDGESGEVFIATDVGLVSFRGTATEASAVHEQVEVFPNPVLPGFNGFVAISGLANNAIVKITDIGGRLVRETQSAGGTASWDVADYNGKRASAGIYLIFSASADGQETFVGKIAVIE